MNNSNKKILFLGETYRADAITWMNGLKEFGGFEIITCELQTSSKSFLKRTFRFVEYLFIVSKIRAIVASQKPDIVIAERSTSYGFLASISGAEIIVIAQQGSCDLWPEDSWTYFIKKRLQHFAYKRATLIHAWGEVMLPEIKAANVPDEKIMVLPKGVNLELFRNENKAAQDTISAIVTRSLYEEYGHETIIQAFSIIKKNNIQFNLTIVGQGNLLGQLQTSAKKSGIANEVTFTGKIDNNTLPNLLSKHNFYLSMPTTEGVSASLFEAMASGCYPIVSDILGNQHFIKTRTNGQLVAVGDAEALANEIIWAFNNADYRQQVIKANRTFVEKNANYKLNMTTIAEKYEQLINNHLCVE